MRIGLRDMKALSKVLFLSVKDNTFIESCGVANLITTCSGGRNRRCADDFSRNGGKRFRLLYEFHRVCSSFILSMVSVGARIFIVGEREKELGENHGTDHDAGVMLHLVNTKLRVMLVMNQLIMKLGELRELLNFTCFN
ncbi:hypothetical protein P3S68_020984 [Capsicum galapagoense]